jgi:hypothetical protein
MELYIFTLDFVNNDVGKIPFPFPGPSLHARTFHVKDSGLDQITL